MQEIPNSSRCDGYCGIESQDSVVEDNLGWETDISANNAKEQTLLNKIGIDGIDLIKFTNSKIPLKTILDKYAINFEEKYSPSGWTHKSCCPFPDHNDSTPSFNYNSIEGRFKCFGCNRFGKAVDFYAAMESISKTSAAEKLLSKYDNIENVAFEVKNSIDDQVDKILFDFSCFINKFMLDNPSSINYAEKIAWCVDVYLEKHVPNSSIDIHNLSTRVQKLKEILVDYV